MSGWSQLPRHPMTPSPIRKGFSLRTPPDSTAFEHLHLYDGRAVGERRRDEAGDESLVKWFHQRKVDPADSVVELDLGGEGATRTLRVGLEGSREFQVPVGIAAHDSSR